MKELLETIIRPLIEHPDQLVIETKEKDNRGYVVYHVRVAKPDMGRIIGKNGRIAKVIRTVMRSAGSRKGEKTVVEIDECE